MRRAVTVLALAVALIASGLGLSVLPAQAQTTAQQPAESSEQVPLKAKDVESFLGSYAALKALAKRLEARFGPPETSDDEDPGGAFSGYLRNDQARAEIEAVLRRFGYPDFETWSRTANSVLIAYGALGDAAPGEGDQSFDKSVEDIRKDPSLSKEQKDAMIAELTEQLSAIEAFRPLPGNIEAVRPFEARLRAILEQE
ncbi:MAG TPA: hypothetical protein VHG30_01905 [Microvirga sp.]|nr:hypothetical protein [Microvirga sp.]